MKSLLYNVKRKKMLKLTHHTWQAPKQNITNIIILENKLIDFNGIQPIRIIQYLEDRELHTLYIYIYIV